MPLNCTNLVESVELSIVLDWQNGLWYDRARVFVRSILALAMGKSNAHRRAKVKIESREVMDEVRGE